MSKQILNKWNVGARSGFILLRIKLIDGLSDYGNDTSGSTNDRQFTKHMIDSQFSISMKLVNKANTRAIRKVTSGELLRTQAMRKKIIVYKK
jgi:hypothetical protein